jgi:hypothetical protein
MPLNRDAFTRYRLIDERLRRKPYPTLEQLIEHVSEGLDKVISRRTIQLDIQEMRYSQSLKLRPPSYLTVRPIATTIQIATILSITCL